MDIRDLKLFKVLESGKVEIDPACRTVPQIKALIARSAKCKGDADGRKKVMAKKELAFIYFYLNKNLYSSFKPKMRVNSIKKMVGLPDEWEPDILVQEIIEMFTEMSLSITEDSLNTLEKLIKDSMEVIETIREGLNIKHEAIKMADFSSLVGEENDGRQALIKEIQQDFTSLIKYANDLPKTLENIEKFRQDLIAEEKDKKRSSGSSNPFTQ